MRTKMLLASAAALGLLGAVLTGCSASDAKTPAASAKASPAAIPVEVAQPRRAELLATYTGTTTLEAESDAEVVTRVSGVVRRILVEEGDVVRAGQVLAELDGEQLRLDLAKARATLAKTERDYRRQVELHQKGLVAAGAFEGLKYDLDTLRASYDLAALQFSYTTIRAPFAGTVSARRIRVGETLQSGVPIFRVTNPQPLKASVFVPERELARLARGQAATIQVDALHGRTFPAHVALLSPTVDAKTATFKVTVQIDDPKTTLMPGMFARVGIVFERRPQALQIPRVALIEADGTTSVFVAKAGKAEQRTVKTGLTDAGNVEILEGLKDDEQVVIVGQSGLKSGNPLRIVSLEPAAKLR